MLVSPYSIEDVPVEFNTELGEESLCILSCKSLVAPIIEAF
jgi:hypothetical protein